jgi:hypothetical protein
MAATLTAQYHRSDVEVEHQAYGLRVLISASSGMPKEVFVFQHGTAPPPEAGEDPTDEFVCLADPVDLEEVPPNTPDLDNDMPYFRLAEVTLYYRSVAELEDAQTLIAEDLQRLVDSINTLETMPLTSEVTYE